MNIQWFPLNFPPILCMYQAIRNYIQIPPPGLLVRSKGAAASAIGDVSTSALLTTWVADGNLSAIPSTWWVDPEPLGNLSGSSDIENDGMSAMCDDWDINALSSAVPLVDDLRTRRRSCDIDGGNVVVLGINWGGQEMNGGTSSADLWRMTVNTNNRQYVYGKQIYSNVYR